MAITLHGLRTVIYPTPDIEAAKSWWTGLVGAEPYFDEPFYVGYNIAGYELGLLPDGNPADGAITYWGVDDVSAAVDAALTLGGTPHAPVVEVGGGIVTGSVVNPEGMIVGFIFNPHFTLGG
jgi:catechol 2,3-dioxygenase-like lactoylglutathione lyase family enzyme